MSKRGNSLKASKLISVAGFFDFLTVAHHSMVILGYVILLDSKSVNIYKVFQV